MVKPSIKKNIGLLKNPLNTFISVPFNFLQFIWLNTYKKTKALKNIVKWLASFSFHYFIPNELGILNIEGPRYKSKESTEI